MADPDPDHLVEQWTGHIPPPTASSEDTSNCRHCLVKFSMGHKHACRLCGFMYCSRCTEKVHLHPKYQIKGKTGPCRACCRCLSTCFDEKIKTVNDEDTRERVRLWGMSQSRLREIYPPEWVDIRVVPDCNKCRKKTTQKHICRACGKCYCNSCSMKHEFPDAFKKKPKPGPRRCCDKCRFLIIDGFKLVAVPSEKPQVPTRRPTMTKKDTPAAVAGESASGSVTPAAGSSAKFPKTPSKPKSEDKKDTAKDEDKPKTSVSDGKATTTSTLPFSQRCCVAGCQFPRAATGLYCEGHVNGTIDDEPPPEDETPKQKKKLPVGISMMGPAFGQPMPGMGIAPTLKKTGPASPTSPTNTSAARINTVPPAKVPPKTAPTTDPSETVVAEGSDDEAKTEAGSDGDSPLEEVVPRHAKPPPKTVPGPTPPGGEPAWKQKLNEQKAAKQAKDDEERRKKQFGAGPTPPARPSERWGDENEPKNTAAGGSKTATLPSSPKGPVPPPKKVTKELPPMPVRPKKEKVDVLVQAGFDPKKSYVEVLWDDDGNMDDDEIPLTKGEYLEVKDQSDGEGWWYGVKLANRKVEGLFPYNLVKVLDLAAIKAELQAKQDALDDAENQAFEAQEKAAIAAREAAAAEAAAEEAAAEIETRRMEQEKAEREAKEAAAKEAAAKEAAAKKAAAEKAAAEKAAAEKAAADKAAAEKAATEKAAAEKAAAEKAAADKAAREKAEADKLAKDQAAKAKADADRAAAAKSAKEKADVAATAKVKAAAAEDAAKAKAAAAQAAKEKADAERAAKEQADAEAKAKADAAAAAAAEAAAKQQPAAGGANKKKKTLCPCIYDHAPGADNEDELAMKKGDIILVLKKDPDGWWMGRNENTGNVGLFPGNYVGPPNP